MASFPSGVPRHGPRLSYKRERRPGDAPMDHDRLAGGDVRHVLAGREGQAKGSEGRRPPAGSISLKTTGRGARTIGRADASQPCATRRREKGLDPAFGRTPNVPPPPRSQNGADPLKVMADTVKTHPNTGDVFLLPQTNESPVARHGDRPAHPLTMPSTRRHETRHTAEGVVKRPAPARARTPEGERGSSRIEQIAGHARPPIRTDATFVTSQILALLPLLPSPKEARR